MKCPLASQSWPPQSQDKGSWSPHQRHAVHWWCSSDDPHPAGAAGTDGPFLSGLQALRTTHQSQGNQCPGAGYTGTASQHYQWLWAWCRWTVHISWLHRHWQPLLGHWDWQEDWEGRHNTCSPHFTSVDQPQTDSEDQDGRVQCLCRQHTNERQRDVDHICQTGEKTQLLPPEKHLLYPGHILARQCPTPRSCPKPTSQACLPCSDSAGCVGWVISTAWRMAVSQKTFLWRAGIWKENQRLPTAALQGCLQERHKSTWHQHSPRRIFQPTTWGGEVLWTNTSSQGKRSWWTQKQGKGPADRSTTPTDHTQMRLMQPRLLLPHQSLQPQATLQ